VERYEKPLINIAVVGGGTYCEDFLEKTTKEYKQNEVNARISAVADPDPNAPGMQAAKRLGIRTLGDYHELYSPHYDIHLFIILTPEEYVLQDILATKPSRIRVQSFEVFEISWKAISIEENKLRRRNEEVETILNGIQDFIVVLNPDLEIVEVNESFLRKMEYTPEQVIGKKCYEIFQHLDAPCNCEEMICPLNEVIRNKRHMRQVRKRKKKDGETRYIEVSTFPVWEKGGKISKLIEISRDITKRKKEEEEITRRLEKMVEDRTRQFEETHEKLLHKDKMASLGKLSAAVVHEINNPIAGTLNLIMLMKRIIKEGSLSMEDTDQFRDYLNLMEKENRRVSRIVSDLLAFSRESKFEPRPININDLVEKTLLLNANLLKIHSIKVERKRAPALPELIGSEDQLQQVFVNFISNAVEAMESKEGGLLTIKTAYLKKNNAVSIAFTDTGVGIPKKYISSLFEPFFTTKKKGKGAGLGLSVAYGIVQDHGGSIKITTREGKGTTFSITFPLERGASTANRGGLYGQQVADR
jgi:PAS domain S-box-containing protein